MTIEKQIIEKVFITYRCEDKKLLHDEDTRLIGEGYERIMAEGFNVTESKSEEPYMTIYEREVK